MTASEPPSAAQVDTAARDALGIARLRPGQRRAVREAAAGRDVLAVMPTGSGKSAIYQLAGVLRPGGTLVISPLLALQQDQIAHLAGRRAGGAAAASSLEPAAERRRALARFADGDVEFFFVAPEQLDRTDTTAALRAADVSLVVVDEAHCISAWGHDFRPDFLRIGETLRRLGRPTVVALTATAAPPVRREIVERLGMRDPAVLLESFDRPEIDLAVQTHRSGRERDAAALASVAPGTTALVYVATRRRAEMLAGALAERGDRAAPYHAGLAAGRRRDVHEAFAAGAVDVVVATSAFGMGIDRPDVRAVVHADAPPSLDAYHQEIGRAGRDGGPARAVLHHLPADLGLRRYQASAGVAQADVASVADALAERGGATRSALSRLPGVSRRRLTLALDALAAVGAVHATGRSRLALTAAPADAVAAVADREARRLGFERSRVDMVRAYVETPGCRRRFLLTYFGEDHPGDCGGCDNCRSGRAATAAPAGDGPYAAGQRVRHATFGDGQVVRVEDGRVVTLFDEVGYRVLDAAVVAAEGLLEPLR